ncbi:hypothetical protein FP435_08190 [Lactobacillus sp. PV037]|uniref:hypothetical protein n=1 Tax=unclassified Lactobacillus TaxID=2620435 RepID=UPI00223F00C0|nr:MULTISPECIES: hypothetical protein [unclassified Lactobacillus]QNQ81556.1 hypothetical protein FP433_00060 [Lactobacillus sp. PV012]QNQ84396.1 hypothetical protein FP435_08190 [Lactobacillus sp. PV037]
MKKVIRILFFLSLIVITGIGSYFIVNKVYRHHQNQKAFSSAPALVSAKDGTSISATRYNLEYFKKQLSKKYPKLYQAVYTTPKTSYRGADVVIPGVKKTISYDYEKNKDTSSFYMTPQGVTIAGNYILITAYDAKHTHASVIYVLNKKGKYLKRIIVAGKPHLGGITYDPIAKNIWLTGTSQGQAALMSIPLKRIEDYNYQKSHQPITYDHEITLPTIERASAVTYDDNQLFVGFFSKDEKGRIVAYPISRIGYFKDTITSDQIKAVTGQSTWASGAGSAAMDSQIQGIAIYKDWIILSQSYGSKDSKLYFFPASAIDNLDEDRADKVVTLPPYLEQISVYKGQLLLLFESSSREYARDDIMIVDRILSANINALLGS